jgi:Ca-activated chloride channel family protein
MRLPTVITALIILLLLPRAGTAQGELVLPCQERRCAPGVICSPLPPCRVGSAVERVRSDVRAELSERVVRYEIRETFVNRGAGLGEADYMLPLPRNAAFRELRLFINGEPVAGEVMSADRARAIYEEIVRRQRDPALVEWMGQGLLRARIFPIAPGERKEVLVRFDAIPEREGDALRVDYFRGTRRGSIQPAPVVRGVRMDREIGSETGERETFRLRYPATLGRAYSPTHRVVLRDDGRSRVAEIVGDAPHVTVLVPVPRRSSISLAAVSHATGGDRHVLLTVTPPAQTGARLPRDVTLVLDVSGSMSGDKIRQARAAGVQLLRTLDERDRFRLIEFSSDVRSFRDDFLPAARGNVAAGIEYLQELRAAGGTNIEGALMEALRGNAGSNRLPLVLFLTDGMPTVGESRADVLAELVSERRQNRRLFTFGVGTDVNVALLEQLAIDGRGTAHFVRSTESIEHAVGIVASRLSEPLLTDVRIQTRGVRLSDAYPRLPTDIFAGQDLVLLARYHGAGRATVRVTGRSAGRDVSFQSVIDFPERERRNDFVPRLWATRRIGHLTAERRRSSDRRELDEEIRELALRYGLPSDVSSYLVLEPGATEPVIAQTTGRRERDLSGRGAVGNAPAPPSPVTRVSEMAVTSGSVAFESARNAAAQRDAATLAVTDAGAGRRALAGRVFELRDSAWVQVSPAPGSRQTTMRIKPFSSAYFDIMDAIPELRAVFALGEKVTVFGRSVAIELDAGGAERIAGSRLRELADAW